MKIGVIGSGAMGSGIAQVFAQAKHQVYILDNNPEALQRAEKHIHKQLENLINKNKINTDEASEISNKITYTVGLSALSTCDLIIEAIIENLDVKKQLFRELELTVSDQCIIATNTSSLSVTQLASICKFPSRVIGIHFFNPATIMPLVEIIPALQTHNQVIEKCKTIITELNKTVVIAKDTPGFIVNRVARPYYSEAFNICEEGIANPETIDYAMKHIGGFRMGPFELTDFIGHDVNYAVTESVWTSFYYDPRFKPNFIQKNLVNANWLGIKSGKGFYEYPIKQDELQIDMNPELHKSIFIRIISMLINEAADALLHKICNLDDLETAMTKGVNYPKGLWAWAQEIGISNIVNELNRLFDLYKNPRYRCCVYLIQAQ